MLLKIENLRIVYNKIIALKGVSLHIKEGEIVAIVGANGAGKSTLLNAISGIVRISQGKVFFENEALNNLPAWKIARRKIVQIPEGRKVFPELTVVENMEMGAFAEKNQHIIKALIEKMYIFFPILRGKRNQPAGTLSGGEQQMLAIARGLMSEPKLLILDEPSMGLAPIMVNKVFQVIKDISAQGITILLVEQNAKKSLAIAHRGYVLETGSICLTGAGEELLNNPQVKRAYLGI